MPNEVWSHNIKKQGSPLDEIVYRNKNHVLRESNKWIVQAIYLNQSIFHFFICMFNPLRRAKQIIFRVESFQCVETWALCTLRVAWRACLILWFFYLFFFCFMIHFNLAERFEWWDVPVGLMLITSWHANHHLRDSALPAAASLQLYWRCQDKHMACKTVFFCNKKQYFKRISSNTLLI